MSAVIDLPELERFAWRAVNNTGNAGNLAKPAKAREFLWYLATPYTHPDPSVRAHRFNAANAMAAALLAGGLNVYSPIAAHHIPGVLMKERGPDHAGWMEICYGVLDRCDGVIVSTMDGYWESKGVQLEIKRWKKASDPKRLLFASPIRANEPWEPRFSWQATKVENL